MNSTLPDTACTYTRNRQTGSKSCSIFYSAFAEKRLADLSWHEFFDK